MNDQVLTRHFLLANKKLANLLCFFHFRVSKFTSVHVYVWYTMCAHMCVQVHTPVYVSVEARGGFQPSCSNTLQSVF